MGTFLDCLEAQLPWSHCPNWLVNFQQEGATAVWSGVEALAHLRAVGPHPRADGAPDKIGSCLVAVAGSSYHGAPSTSLGLPALPRWPNAPRTTGQVAYPLPDGLDSEEYLGKFEQFLQQTPDVGVAIFEPQWGSSRLARTWPPKLLRDVIALCQRRGVYVLCDEVMCGLGVEQNLPGHLSPKPARGSAIPP